MTGNTLIYFRLDFFSPNPDKKNETQPNPTVTQTFSYMLSLLQNGHVAVVVRWWYFLHITCSGVTFFR